MTDTDERLTRVETKLDTLVDQWEKRFTVLQWTVTIGFSWLTVLIAIIAVVKR
jgi:hypothetical protein